jgi:hypothetical protein
MTDRELLELAAKAAGYEINKAPSGALFARFGLIEWIEWNPLTDDGDALRLAVTLEFVVDIVDVARKSVVWVWFSTYNYPIEEAHTNDPYAATRRAIVKAAAEIGKDMGVRNETQTL